MAIDFATFTSVVPFIIEARYPVLLRGRHGIGKSTLVCQIADELSLPIVERRASQMTEGDLLGLPKVEGEVTKWLAPEWLHRACNTGVVLFLDEVDRATTEVRQGIFELCDSRKIAGYTLHEDTVIFAAVNGGEHGATSQQRSGISLTITTSIWSTLETLSLTRFTLPVALGKDCQRPWPLQVSRLRTARFCITSLLLSSALRLLLPSTTT